jgi:hypothetical protein
VKSALDGWPSYNGAAEVLKRLHVQIQERLLGLDQRRLAERRARERRAHHEQMHLEADTDNSAVEKQWLAPMERDLERMRALL